MSKKITQEYVEEEFTKEGYKLLSKYINAKTKLQTICPEGHEWEVTWNNFQKGRRCSKCSGKEKLTYTYVKEEFNKEGYTLISKEYVNNNTKMQTICPEGHKWETTYNNFQKGYRCRVCAGKEVAHEYVEEELNKEGYKLLSIYVNSRTKMKTICPEGHEWNTTWNNFQNGHRCSKCSGREVTSETCIATTNPWMMKFLKNKEDGYNYSHGSQNKVGVICNYCGKEKNMKICDIYNHKSISCSCGDGTSYPEKFIISLLEQLNVKYIKEYKPIWSNNKRYDFYLKDFNCIIECHGEQHYEQSNRGRTLQEEQENDKCKEQLALDNNINNYIVLDCRFSELEQIKNSILNSELNDMFDLSKVNWLKCEEFALSNRVKEVCDYWNNKEEWETTTDLANKFNLGRTTIIRYLKQGVKLGWCNYNSEEEAKKNIKINCKNNCKSVEILKNDKSLGIFKSVIELERQSEELFGVKLLSGHISKVCRDEKPQYKGYTFKYITKEEYEERIKQIKNNN